MNTKICLQLSAMIACSVVLSVSYGQSGQQILQNTSQMQIQNSSSGSRYTYSGRLKPEDANRLADIRQAGLNGDNSQIPAITTLLQHPPHRSFTFTAVRALSRLGATESLPVFAAYLPQTIMQPHQDSNLSNFVRAARARLLAESRTKNINDRQAQTATKVNQYYTELQLTSSDLNNGLAAYRTPQVDTNGMAVYSTGPRAISVEVYAVGELADMVYHGSYKDFASLPGIAQVNFQQDYQSALKMRLAPLSPSERLRTMIQELAHKTALRAEDDYEIQLAINEGPIASRSAAAELRKMDMDRAGYNQVNNHAGFAALFRIIQGVGDKGQAPVIEHFLHDSDTWVVYYAQSVYDDVSNGVKRGRIPAY